jgi:hypothetical protein
MAGGSRMTDRLDSEIREERFCEGLAAKIIFWLKTLRLLFDST